jgi:LDH2 family malate/lactate/ureidoglycolate dehydrogenase
MRVSYPELYVLCKKVLEANGFPFGAMEDGADMIAWAEFAGLKGLEQLTKELDELGGANPAAVRVTAESNRLSIFDGAGQSSLVSGRLAADLAYAKARENGIGAVEVNHSRGSDWLVQNALQIAERGMACAVSWSDKQGRYFAMIRPDMRQPVIGRKSSNGSEKTGFMIICAKPEDLSLKIPGQAVILQPEEIQERWHAAMKYGKEVDEAVWEKLVQVASRVLVEATEFSRLRGAGENA